jgi:lipopolysaccharide transport system ATP-binding protein
VRLAFAVAAHLDPDILLLDEVLAVGDFAFQRKCMNFAQGLEKKGATILFVSHNMFSIKSMCDRVIYLKKGRVEFDGPTIEGLKLYEDDSRLSDTPWFDSENAPIKFTDVAFLNERGQPSTVFDHGERMIVRLRYHASRRIERPDFRVGVEHTEDIAVTTYSTQSDGLDLPYVEGDGEIELTTPPLKLVSDLYRANIIVRDAKASLVCAQIGGHFHVRHPLFSFPAFGLFHEPGEWRVRTAGPQRSEIKDDVRQHG